VTPPNRIDDDSTAGERQGLRRSLRQRRASLSAQQRVTAARTIAAHIAATRWLQGARPIALYVSIGFEVDTGPLAAVARRRRCPIYLPRITDYRAHHMRFVLQSPAPSVRNRHGIPEPRGGQSIAPGALSVVFLPVLGFDALGTRLGSGAGYYDRVFSFRRRRLRWHRPLLVGIAYRCQELAAIQPEPHDVPLDALVTEDGVRYFRQRG
jgi:5-formyltetrahydrofolate cyclo-ligase